MSQKRYAYLIGANGPHEQGIEPLHYTIQDIEHLEKVLNSYPCEFTRAEKVIAINSSVVTTGLELLANGCLPSDLLFIHFAGHALLFDGHLYLICDNTDIRRKLFSSTAIDIDVIKTILGRCKAKHKLLVLDCCHAAAAHDGGTWRGEQALEYALEELKGNANFILSACASNKRTRELETLEFEHKKGAGFLSWALATACSSEFPNVAQDQALSLTDFWNWLPRVLETVNNDLPKSDQIPTPKLFGESALVRAIAKASPAGSYAREQIKGSLGEQIDKTLRWIVSNLRTISENTGIGQRIDRCEIPETALRELVVNAIVHRDYTAKENVKIEITPKKIIITNPGRLIPAIVNCVPPFAYRNSHPPNPSLMNVLVEQQWAERLSRGFEIVQEEFQKYGLPLPEIKNLDNGLVQVTIERPDISVVNKMEAGGQSNDSTDLSLPSVSQSTQLIWNIPYQRNPFFTDREELLQQLHQHFSTRKSGTVALTQTQAISGLGGIGKTQAAVEYAYRYRDEYVAVFWVNATSTETLSEGFAAIARLLNLPEKDEPDRNLVVQAVRKWLTTHTNWLLLLDNADDFELLLKHINTYLPTEGQGHVLITTREQATGAISNFQVDKMGHEESILLLLRRTHILPNTEVSLSQASPADQATAAEIVAALDGLPLALDQAAAYIEETACGLSGYLEAYRERQVDLLRQRGRTSPGHPNSVVATWSLSFEQVEQRDPLAADLLRFLAFLAPDNIPEEIILQGAEELSPGLQQLANDPALLNDALATLRRYSLIRRNPTNHTLTIHRLVQSVLRSTMPEETRRQWAERTIKAVNSAFPESDDINTWLQCERLLPHALACVQLIDLYGFTFSEAARLLNEVATYLEDHAQYEQAEPLYQRALAIREKVLGPEHPATAASLNNLAELYRVQGKYEHAEPLYQRALIIDEKVHGSEHPEVATDLNNLANLYHDQGKYELAESLYRSAIAIGEKTLGPEHPNLATRLNNLANLYVEQSKYELAEPLYQRAIAIAEKVLGPEHPDLATGLNNLAGLYHDQGKYEQAELLYQRALSIKEKMLGPEHPSTAANLNNLANLYYQQGKYEQAEPLYWRAITIGEQVLGTGHPTVATWLNNLAALYANEGKYAEAESLYRRAIAIAEKALGTEHPNTIVYRENYANFLEKNGK